MDFTGLGKGTNLYLSRQYIGDVHTVEGVYRCSRNSRNLKMTFYMGFINTSDQDITLLPNLEGLYASTCGEQKVTYPLPPGQPKPTGSINQLNPNQKLSTTRQTEILTELCINENQYLKDHPRVKGQLTCMIHKYAYVFTPKSEGKVGVTDLMELELKLAPGPVVRQKPRPLNPTMKVSLDHQIADWLQNGVITKSVSEYSSSLVPVKKKDGTVRCCVDFRQVNNRIIADSFPIPHIEELVQKAEMLRPSKTFLFQLEVEYLGHQLSVNGIAMIPSYQNKVTSWPSPTSKQELIHMLGVFGYYRAFVLNFAMTTQGFTALRKSGVDFK